MYTGIFTYIYPVECGHDSHFSPDVGKESIHGSIWITITKLNIDLTLPETNSSHLKTDGWNTFSFPFGMAYFHSLSRPGPWKKKLNGLFSLLNM